MAENLRPEGIPVYVGDVALTTPGLSGHVEVYQAGMPQMRGAEETTDAFLTALDEARLSEQLTIEITDHSELDAEGGTRASGGGNEIVAEVPGPGEGNGQVLLYAAEDGSLTWHFPDDIAPADVPHRGGDRRTYRIPRAVTLADDAAGQRGILGAVGKKLLKVLVFPLLDPVLGRVGDYFASRWEKTHRRYLVRAFDPANYRCGEAGALTAADWQRLAMGPALLFVHGTMSQSHTGFQRIPLDLMEQLYDRYGRRVFAFDHFTVSETPTQNAA